MTLIARAGDDRVFEAALQKYFGGKPDGHTLAGLST
jgi:uncharacterized protein (DUF1810 family)